MVSNPLRCAPAGQSHSLRLLQTLFDLGIIPRGRFSLAHVRHDEECPALAEGSGLHCCCNPEVEVAGRCYLYSDLVEPGGQA